MPVMPSEYETEASSIPAHNLRDATATRSSSHAFSRREGGLEIPPMRTPSYVTQDPLGTEFDCNVAECPLLDYSIEPLVLENQSPAMSFTLDHGDPYVYGPRGTAAAPLMNEWLEEFLETSMHSESETAGLRYSAFPFLPARRSTYSSRQSRASSGSVFSADSVLSSEQKPRAPSTDTRGSYQCAQCGRRSTCPKDARRHQKTHTSERPYVCAEDYCVTFHSKDNLLRHLQNVHGWLNEDIEVYMVGKGYHKPRGERTNESLQPLMQAPLSSTSTADDVQNKMSDFTIEQPDKRRRTSQITQRHDYEPFLAGPSFELPLGAGGDTSPHRLYDLEIRAKPLENNRFRESVIREGGTRGKSDQEHTSVAHIESNTSTGPQVDGLTSSVSSSNEPSQSQPPALGNFRASSVSLGPESDSDAAMSTSTLDNQATSPSTLASSVMTSDYSDETWSDISEPPAADPYNNRTPKGMILFCLMQIFRKWLYKTLSDEQEKCSDHGECTERGGPAGSSGKHSAIEEHNESSTTETWGGKRTLRRSDREDNESGSNKRRAPSGDLCSVPEDAALPFACHFWKRTPRSYDTAEWRACALRFTEVHRVKQHLFEHHCLKPRCARCCEEFITEDEVEEHLRQPTTCEVRSIPVSNGMTKEMQEKLRSRRGLSKMTAYKKWVHWYKILFPDDPDTWMPTPYHDGVTSVLDVEVEYARYVLPLQVQQQLEQVLTTQMHTHIPELLNVLRGAIRTVFDANNLQLPSIDSATDLGLPSSSTNADGPESYEQLFEMLVRHDAAGSENTT